jgi:predicted O-methyltransferase YrrM
MPDGRAFDGAGRVEQDAPAFHDLRRAQGDDVNRVEREPNPRASVLNRAATALWRRQNAAHLERLPAGQEPPRVDLTLARLPRLAIDRVALTLARRARRGEEAPWITEDAIHLLETLMLPSDRGLEYGSGSSTTWLAHRALELRSVEATASWHAQVRDRLSAQGLERAEIVLVDGDRDPGWNTTEHRDAYVHAHPDLAPGTLDWVFVDGEYRDHCTEHAIELLRPGGLLVIDNVEIYLPGPGRSPWTVDAPVTDLWKQLYDRYLSHWRMVWTTNGVWDTAIWWKPATS